MARLTEIYYIKYSDEVANHHRVPKLYKPDGLEQTNHQFHVEAFNGVVFVFTIPSDGPELTLRFNKATDPANTPRQPISWTEASEPAWIVLYNPIDSPYKTLSLVVDSTKEPVGRQASFNLNFYDPAKSMFFALRIQEDGGMPLDPTIIEKPPEY
ncbi:MAG TPA: hypothetical protein VGS07_33325 [Thermoanaerobaculia bacterium]|jgi:hypothetical protein|nr:hypothetical protein [Thermoanaerobaculia bacterium]